MVTWVRQKDLHILTIGKYTYISDTRFKASNDQSSDTWILEMKNSKESDSGVYECQVSTEEIKTLQMYLKVIASKARIIEGNSLYVETGSSISVSCQVTHAIYPSEYIVWYHGNFIIRNGDRNSRVNIRTDRRDMDFSELSITNAKSTDSGEYSCKPSSGHPANITIMVLNGRYHI
ncbi:Lachesin [Nymphon striatum]|nr:Lachesin [Nymphon striatum]